MLQLPDVDHVRRAPSSLETRSPRRARTCAAAPTPHRSRAASARSYGLGIGDVWVWGPNATGLALGLVQLALKLIFRSTPRRLEEQRTLCRGAKESCSDDDSAGGVGAGAGAQHA